MRNLARIDKDRKKKGSNDDWHNPHDPDAKMTDGSTRLAHKAEHAVDVASGVLLAVNVCDAVVGDTQTIVGTVNQASENLRRVEDDERTADKIDPDWAGEVVADKGYHSNDTMADLKEMGTRTYVAEPDRGPRVWTPDRATEEETARLHEALDATCQPEADARQAREGPDAPPRRGARTVVRPRVRDGGHKATAPAGPSEHRQAGAGPRRRVQPGAVDAGQVRHAQAQEESRVARAAVWAAAGRVLAVCRSLAAVASPVRRPGSTIWSIQLGHLHAAA